MNDTPSRAAQLWATTRDEDVDVSSIDDVLAAIHDDLWVATACIERILDDLVLERKLVELGLARTQELVTRAQEGVDAEAADEEDENEAEEGLGLQSTSKRDTAAQQYFATHRREAQACYVRAALLSRLDKISTYQELVETRALADEAPDIDLDPWADTDDAPTEPSESPALTLLDFISLPLEDAAIELATASKYRAIQILLRRHSSRLWPFRFGILGALPLHAHPSEYVELLPRLDSTFESEACLSETQQARSQEWCELNEVTSALRSYWPELYNESGSIELDCANEPLSASQLSSWYRERALRIERSSGMVDMSLAFIQHGASQGIPALDELGEELSLLERLVYDAPQSSDPRLVKEWSLDQWMKLSPLDVVKAYLAHSTSTSVVDTIRSLVMPYLYVLEARAERAGSPDSGLPMRILTEYLLEAPLALLAAVFEASKPTLPITQRILKDDAHMARLALACLYGSDSLYEWGTMSRIFECLPAWEGAQGADEEDEADTTLLSLGAFVTPSTSRPKCTAADLLVFFTPLPAFALSRALDVLDIHLDSGEILARWSVPAPLRWFLQSADNIIEQRAYATRIARRAGGGRDDELENEDQWDALKDMLKLAAGGRGPLKGPFGSLQKEEVLRIFFGGLLSAGRFQIARALLNPSETSRPLEPHVVEDLVLEASREFYDNASSGNLHHGEMKLAYECLAVAPQTATIRKERDFIEATSRICSYHVRSRSGGQITPIEIRLEKDRLSLIARVIASTDDAYKHSQVMLELANKLGVPGDARVYGMLADAALAAEDFVGAEAACTKMISSIHTPEDADVAWRTAFQLGRQAEWENLNARIRLLGHAARLCPPEHMQDVLASWRRVEREQLDARRATPRQGRMQKRVNRSEHVGTAITSLAARLQGMHVPGSPVTSDAAARAIVAGGHRAAVTLSRVAGVFPFGGHARTNSGDDQQRSETPDLSNAARQVFSRGVGWLIGED